MSRKLINNDPLVYTINNFIDDDLINHIIKVCEPKMQKALVADNKKGVISDGRTNTNCWIKHDYDNNFLSLGESIAKLVNIPLENAEAFQVIHYDENQEYKQHYDGWDFDNSEKSRRNMRFGGQRICTALCYLNDVTDGGGTKFTKINKEVYAEKGKLLIFYNVYNGTNKKHVLSEHAGMPVIKGEKWAFNLWFREESRSKEYIYKPIGLDNIVNTPYKNEQVEINTHNNILSSDDLLTILTQCDFKDDDKSSIWLDNKKITNIITKINSVIKIDSSYFENMCITKYKKGIVHSDHLDAYDITKENGIKYIEQHGQRLITMTGFLTETLVNFTKLNKLYKCNPGSLLIYNNCYANSKNRITNISKNYSSINEGNMIIFNIYIREKSKSHKKILNINNFIPEYNDPIILDYTTIINNLYNKPLEENLINSNFKFINKAPMEYTKNTILKIKTLKETNEILNKENLDRIYNFDEFNPVVVENVLDKYIHKIIDEYFKENIKNGVYPLGDRQANRYKIIDEVMTRLLHLEILPLIEKITNKKLDPTYTYLSAYLKGTDLHAHTDRPECEFTVSYIIGKPEGSNWNIYLHKKKQPVKFKGRYDETPPKDECIPVDCNENGLMIFSGTDHIHYREALEYDYYNIVLLHYKSKK